MSMSFYLEDNGNDELELVYYLGNGYTDRYSTGKIYNKNYIESVLGDGLNVRKNKQSTHTYSLFYSSVSDFEEDLLKQIKKLAIKDRIEKTPLFKHCETYYTVVYKEYPSNEWKYVLSHSLQISKNNVSDKSPDGFICYLPKELSIQDTEAYLLLTATKDKDYNWCDLNDIMRFINQTEEVELISLKQYFDYI